jgi:hypothetical protein
VVNVTEFLTACYTDPETVLHVMDLVTKLIIEFSRVQADRIGEDLLAKPGHIMPSSTAYQGISISDDNLAVSSPTINERIALPFDRQIAEAFDGVAIHSCGQWAHTMAKLHPRDNVLMIDCALTTDPDPTPNKAVDVREALKGRKITTKVRLGSDMDRVLPILEQLFDPSLRLIVEIAYDPEHAERNYKMVNDKLDALYASTS